MGMRIDTGNMNPFVKCYFDDDDESEGFVELRVLPASKSREIEKKTTKVKKTMKRGMVTTDEVVNDKLRDEMMWSYCIGKWEGVIDQNGKPIENDTKHKVLLMANSPVFAEFVGENIGIASDTANEEAEAEEKN